MVGANRLVANLRAAIVASMSLTDLNTPPEVSRKPVSNP
jgi:hypothetical protein